MLKNRIKYAKLGSVLIFLISLIVFEKKNREHYFSFDPRTEYSSTFSGILA